MTTETSNVRGLVAKWRAEADEIAANNWTCNSNSIRARADELEAALAAEGVQCETCDDSKAVVTYVDPYERGDVSSPEQSPCPDCAEGVQAGDVEQRARELLALHCECGGGMQFTKTSDALRAIAAALTGGRNG